MADQQRPPPLAPPTNPVTNTSVATPNNSVPMTRAPSVPQQIPQQQPLPPQALPPPPNGGMQGPGHMGSPPIQVIHQSMPTPPYMPQFPYNQQFMLQNAAAIQAAMQAQVINNQLNLAAMQGRVTSGSPHTQSIMCPSSAPQSQPMATLPSAPTSGVTMATSGSPTSITPRVSTNSKSPNGNQQSQNVTLMNKAQAQFVQRQMAAASGASQPIVIGQIGAMGMMPGQSSNFMPTQNDPSKGSNPPSVTPAHSQVFASQPQLRLPNGQGTQLPSNAQIITPQMLATNPALLQAMASFQQGLPFAHLTGQMPGQIPGQMPGQMPPGTPMYMRTAGLVQPQTGLIQPTQSVLPNVVRPQSQPPAISNKPHEPSSDQQTLKQSGVVTAKPNNQNRVFSAILPMSSKPSAVTAKVQPTNVTAITTTSTTPTTTAKVPPSTIMTSKPKTSPSVSSAPRLNIPQPGAVKTVSKPRPKQPKAVTVASAIAQVKSNKQMLNQLKATGSIAIATTQLNQPGHLSQNHPPHTTTVHIITPSPLNINHPVTSTIQTNTVASVKTTVTNASVVKLVSSVPVMSPTKPQKVKHVTSAVSSGVVATPAVSRPKPLSMQKGDLVDKKETPLSVQKGDLVEKKKAVVKPQILTHVIDGFVIQEGPEPFPIQRSSLLTEFIPPTAYNQKLSDKESEEEEGPPCLTPEQSPADDSAPPTMRKCEFCGKVDKDKKFRRSKRFCSMACAKRYNIGFSRRWGRDGNTGPGDTHTGPPSEPLKLSRKRKHSFKAHRSTWHIERPAQLHTPQYMSGEDQSSSLGDRESSSSPPNTPPSQRAASDDAASAPHTNPTTWTVQDVYDFIRAIKGCDNYAEEFRSQEIDGQALVLLKEDHLMSAMSMKLGPALKICAQITTMKQEFS